MHLRSAVIVLSLAAASAAAFAQVNSFQIVAKSGRVIGKASYSIDKTKDGFKVRSKFEYRTGIAVVSNNPDPDKPTSDGANATDTQVVGEYKLDDTGIFVSGFTNNATTQTLTSITPTKTRDAVTIGQVQGGVSQGSLPLTMPKPDFLIAPDYDPSCMQVLLTTVLNHPHAGHLYLLLVPSVGKTMSQPLYLTVADPTDATGTLDGKPVALKRYALGWNKAKGALFADATGNLMQVENGLLKASYVRLKFKLDDADAPAKP